MRMMNARHERHATTLRDLAMMVVAAHGASYLDDHLVIEYRARHGEQPHGIDIWIRDDRTTKVLCVVWSGDDAMVVSFRSGPWERALRRAAAGASVRRRMAVM
jgi:hypothetical protein